MRSEASRAPSVDCDQPPGFDMSTPGWKCTTLWASPISQLLCGYMVVWEGAGSA
jgi:hypothetical protein